MKVRRIYVLLVLFAGLVLSACEGEKRVEKQDRADFILNTFVTINIYDEAELEEEKWAEIFDGIRDIEAHLSKYDEKSEVSMINKMAGRERVEVSKLTYEVLSFAR